LREHFVEGGNAVHRKQRLSNEITTNREVRSNWSEAMPVNTISLPGNCEPRKLQHGTEDIGLSLFHADGKTGEWQLATSNETSAGLWLDGAVHGTGA